MYTYLVEYDENTDNGTKLLTLLDKHIHNPRELGGIYPARSLLPKGNRLKLNKKQSG